MFLIVDKDPKALRGAVTCSRSQERWHRVGGEPDLLTLKLGLMLPPPLASGCSCDLPHERWYQEKEVSFVAKDPLVIWENLSLAKAKSAAPGREASRIVEAPASGRAELGSSPRVSIF